jgi:hypothetical protein
MTCPAQDPIVKLMGESDDSATRTSERRGRLRGVFTNVGRGPESRVDGGPTRSVPVTPVG